MALKLVSSTDTASSSGFTYAKASGAITAGDLLYWGTNGLVACDGSTEKTYTVEAVACADAVTGATVIHAIPVTSSQIWELPMNGDISTTMLGETGIMATGGTGVANATQDTTSTAVYKIIGYAGALTDRRALVRIQRSSYKTS